MSVTIELDEQAAAAFEVIRQRAAAAGEPLARYLRAITERALSVVPGTGRSPEQGPLTEVEMKQWFADMTADFPEDVPPLPSDFSREDIYFDHD